MSRRLAFSLCTITAALARDPLRASVGLEAAGSSSHSAQRWNPAISRPAPELAGCVCNNFSRRGRLDATLLLCSSLFRFFFFFNNSGSFVNKKRHSNPLFFPPSFLLFHLLGVGWWCSVSRGLRAVAVPLYVPPSLCSLLVPRRGCCLRFFFLFVSFLFRPVVGVVRTRPWRTSTAVPSIHRSRLLLGLLPCQDAAGCTSSVCTAGAAPGEHTDRVKKRGIWSELPKCFFHTRKIFADFTWVWILSEKAEQTHLQPGDVIIFFDLGLFSGWRWKCFT